MKGPNQQRPLAAIFIHPRHCHAIVQNSIDFAKVPRIFCLIFTKLFDSWTYFANTWQVLDMQNSLTNSAGGPLKQTKMGRVFFWPLSKKCKLSNFSHGCYFPLLSNFCPSTTSSLSFVVSHRVLFCCVAGSCVIIRCFCRRRLITTWQWSVHLYHGSAWKIPHGKTIRVMLEDKAFVIQKNRGSFCPPLSRYARLFPVQRKWGDNW